MIASVRIGQEQEGKGCRQVIRKRSLERLILLIIFGALFASHALAQSTGQGVISGIITDSTGASVNHAAVTVRNTDTNVSINAVTNDTGYYEVRDLNQGPYEISAVASGFERLIRSGIVLLAEGHPSIDLQLKIGSSSQSIVVNAAAPLVDTQAVSIGQVLTSEEMSALPNGQASVWLAMLSPGVQSNYAQNYQLGGADPNWNGSGPQFGSYGRIGANEFSLDGAPNMAGQRGQAINLSAEELSQTSVNVTSFDASVGHTYGLLLTQTTKSGTNNLHGGIRYRRYDLRWFGLQHFQRFTYQYHTQIDNCAANPGSAACQRDENTYGWPGTHLNFGDAAIGGPVFIPKLYDGRNKFFFFVGVELEAPNNASSTALAVPTVRERSGDFSDLITPTTAPANATAFTSACGANAPFYGQYQLYNPYSVTIDSKGVPRRAPFCGNVIPASLISKLPLVQIVNGFLPSPSSLAVTGNNYNYTPVNWNTYRAVTNRFDYTLSDADHIFFRWSRAHYYQLAQDFQTGDQGRQGVHHWIPTGALGWSHILSPKMVIDAVVGATEWTGYGDLYPGWQSYKPSDLGLPSYLDDYAGSNAQFPVITMSGYQTIGKTAIDVTHFRSLAFRGNLTAVLANHTLRAGAEWRSQNAAGGGPASSNTTAGPSGQFNFDNTYVQQNNGTDGTYPSTSTGLSFASFLLGIPTTSQATKTTSTSRSNPYYSFYVGDTWRVSRKLTIIPGIRYEFEYGPTEKHNRQIVGWDPTAPLTFASIVENAYQSTLASLTSAQKAVAPAHLNIQGGPIYAGVNGASTRQWVNNWRVLPRFGAAYSFTPKTVLRGGAGLYYDTLDVLNDNATINTDGFSSTTGPVASSTNFGTDFVPNTSPLSNPFPIINGSRFTAPVGSSLGADYYAGTSATVAIYDHNRVPARSWRAQFSMEHQIGDSLVVQIAYVASRTRNITLDGSANSTRTYTAGYLNATAVPAPFFAGGTQPNSATNSLLGANVPNPFYIGNLGSLSTSDPVYYNLLTKSSYVNSKTIQLANLVRPNPQLAALRLYKSIGGSQFQEFQANMSKRISNGLVANASYQKNYQKDRDYFENPFDVHPSLESSLQSPPWRFTASWVYSLPFGRNMRFATSGWQSAVFGGFQFSGSYETNPGTLLTFAANGSGSGQGNIFFIGDPNSIRLKKQTYNTNYSTGTATIQGFNTQSVAATASTTNSITTCTYSGTGFVLLPACQPNNYNLRVFPIHVEGVRGQALNNWNGALGRTFNTGERLKVQARAEILNLFNHQRVAPVGGAQLNPSNAQFGLVTSDNGNGRTITLQVLATF
jgi:hypothetical protein